MSGDNRSGARPAVKWHVLVACFLAYAFDAMDFMLLALAMPAIIAEWNLSLSDAGLLGTATLAGVGLSSVVIGWYADNYGRRPALIASLVVFGVLTGAIALARGWTDLMVLRFLAGLGLGGVWGVAAAFISETWPAEQRGRATSFVLGSWPIGFGCAAFIASIILPSYGWRALFLCGLGAVVAALYTALFVPESAAWAEQREQRRHSAAGRQRVSVGELFAPEYLRTTVFGTLASASALVGYWGANTWVPTYLVRDRGLDAADMSWFVVMLNIGMFVGYQAFGWLADKIGRPAALLWSFGGAVVMLPIYGLSANTTLLFWLGPVVALFFCYAGIFGSYFSELYPARIRSLGAGFCFNVGRGISALAPFVLGIIAARYGLGVSVALCAVGFLFAALFTVLLARSPRPTQTGQAQRLVQEASAAAKTT